MSEKLDFLKAVLARTDLPAKDQSFLVNLMWTQDQLPLIRTDREFAQYREMKREIEEKAIAAGVLLKGIEGASEAQKAAFVEFMRSPEGVHLNALHVRLIEWTGDLPPE